MIKFVVKDGTTFNISDGSTPYAVIVTVPMDDIQKTLKAMSAENLKAVKFADRPTMELVNQSVQLTDNGDDTVTLIFSNTTPSEEELTRRKIADLEEAITALTEA